MTATHVLIVDDEADHALIVRHLLGALAPGAVIETIEVADGLAERLRDVPAGAAVLLDRLLGGVETLPVLEGLAAREDLRVALVSAWLPPEEERRALEAGAFLATTKPATLDGWRALLRELLGVPAER